MDKKIILFGMAAVFLAITVSLSGCIVNESEKGRCGVPDGSTFTEEPMAQENITLKCYPVVKVTGNNLSVTGLNYSGAHDAFCENYSGSDLSVKLRDLTVEYMEAEAADLGENATMLRECIMATYVNWSARPCRLPCYAEKAEYGEEAIWAIAFNRCNGFGEDGLGHIDIYYVSIAKMEIGLEAGCYSWGCNGTAGPIVNCEGCD